MAKPLSMHPNHSPGSACQAYISDKMEWDGTAFPWVFQEVVLQTAVACKLHPPLLWNGGLVKSGPGLSHSATWDV